MAIVELKSYLCECDECGRGSAIWTLIPEERVEEVVPDDWAVVGNKSKGMHWTYCSECADKLGYFKKGADHAPTE